MKWSAWLFVLALVTLGCVVGLATLRGGATRLPDVVTVDHCLAATAPERLQTSEVNPLLEAIRQKYDLPAIAGAIVTSRGLVASGAVGERRCGSGVAVTVSDQFHLGSCTKAMTATLIGRLVEQGKLAWTTTIAEVFPEWSDRILAPYRTVTVEQLLMHRGGFSYESWLQGMDFGSTHQLPGLPRQQRRAYVERALQQSPAVPSGEFLYANMGYAVAGAIAEQVMDEAWEDLMVRLLFQPLDMATAGFGAMGTARQIDQPWQHRGDRSQRQAIEPGFLSDNPAAIAPAGTVHASIDDWAKFIALHLQGELNNSTLLQPATIQKLHTPPQGEDYALGWLVTERDWGGGQVLTHAGSNTQNYAVVWMAPQRDFAVLVMTNQGGDWVFPAIDEAAWALIQQFLSSHP